MIYGFRLCCYWTKVLKYSVAISPCLAAKTPTSQCMCMCMCVYVHVCVCACVCMCMCVYVHVCVQVGKNLHKLLIIGTTGFDNDVLELTGLGSAFNSSINVPFLSNGSEVLAVLQSNMYQFSSQETTALEARLKGKRYILQW